MVKSKTYCIFSAQFLPHLGGVERYTYNLGKKLLEYGHKVIVVTSNTDKLCKKEDVDGILVYRMPCFNLLHGRFPISKVNKQFLKLHRELLNQKIDYVIVNTRFYFHSYYGVSFAKKKGVNAIVIEHGTNHFTVNNRLLDFFGEVYEHFITFAIKQKCNKFYGVSKACSKWLEHFGIISAGEFYNAVNITEIDMLKNNTEVDILQEFQIPNDVFIITFTGRLVREKGVEKLIEAFKMVLHRHSGLHLCIAGDGELYAELRDKATENIHILGKLSFPQVINLLKQTSIYVLPTDYPEGFPTSVLEAAACKCYIITTSAGGSKELIISDRFGKILKKNTIEEICESIVDIISDEDERLDAGRNVYDRVVEMFTWDATANKIICSLESDV